MRAQDRGRWATALAAGRKRWQQADVAERAVIASELDALYAELGGKRAIAAAFDEAYAPNEVTVGPKHCALGALLADKASDNAPDNGPDKGSPGAG